MKTIIGIDPGLNGGIAWIDICGVNGITDLDSTKLMTTGEGKYRELDLSWLVNYFEGGVDFDLARIHAVAIEKVHSMPAQGVASTFKFGKGYGQLLGICAALKLPVIDVTPQAWKKKILVGTAWKGNKKASIQFVQKRFPELKISNSDDGKADALCIALSACIATEPA